MQRWKNIFLINEEYSTVPIPKHSKIVMTLDTVGFFKDKTCDFSDSKEPILSIEIEHTW